MVAKHTQTYNRGVAPRRSTVYMGDDSRSDGAGVEENLCFLVPSVTVQ